MPRTVQWGEFLLTKTVDGLRLRDESGELWGIALCEQPTPLFVNWYGYLYVLDGYVRGAATLPPRKRRRLWSRTDQWLQRAAVFAQSLSENNPLRSDLVALVRKHERRADPDIPCYKRVPRDPRKLFQLDVTAGLWAFDQFRRACDDVEQLRSSRADALEFLLCGVPSAMGWRHDDREKVDAIEKRILRFESEHLHHEHADTLMEVVLHRVTTGPLRPDGTHRTNPTPLDRQN